MWYFSNKFLPSSSGSQVRTALVVILEESLCLPWPTLRRRFLLSDTDVLLYGLWPLERIYQFVYMCMWIPENHLGLGAIYPVFLRQSLISLRLTDLARQVDQQTAVFVSPALRLQTTIPSFFSVASGGQIQVHMLAMQAYYWLSYLFSFQN